MKREEILAVLDFVAESLCYEGFPNRELEAAREVIASALDDAGRYRWLKASLYRQWFRVGEAEIGMRIFGACPSPGEVDAAIDTDRSDCAAGRSGV